MRGQLILRSRVRLRNGTDEYDADQYGFLGIDVGDPEEDAITYRLSGRLSWDVDADDGDVFDGIDDSWRHSMQGRLFDAYADLHGYDDLSLFRIGRQTDLETPRRVVYDGLRLESRDLGDRSTRIGVYGGRSAHYYESSGNGDYVAGAYLETVPWKRGRVRFDWLRAVDDRDQNELSGDLVAASLWHRLSERLRTHASYSLLSGDSRDLDLSATWYDREPELLVRLSYYRLFETQAANPLEFDTFSRSLFDYFPFQRAGVTVSRRITPRIVGQLGADLRDVIDDGDEGSFNRDFRRYYVTTTIDPIVTDTSASLTADLWESSEQSTGSFGADLTHRFSQITRGSIGTRYALYEFDTLFVTERQNVRVYYVSVERDVTDSLDLDLAYDFEDGALDFQTLRIRLRWRF